MKLLPAPRVRKPAAMIAAVCAVLLLPAVSTSPAKAQVRVGSTWITEPVVPDFDIADEQLLLDLDEAIAIALRNNLGLLVQRYQRSQSLFRIDQEFGIYDLVLGVNTSVNSDSRPSVSQLDGAAVTENETIVANVELRQPISSGGDFSINFDNSRSTSNSRFSDINPSLRSSLTVAFNQPLLRNRGKRITERNLAVARLNSDISLEDLEVQVVDTVQTVANGYWALVEGLEQLKVAEESLALAEELHEMNRIQIEVGTLAPLELVQSEAGIATREEEIIRVQAQIEDAADELRRLLNLDETSFWNLEIVPTTSPEISRVVIDLEASLNWALERRAEIERQELQIASLVIDSDFLRNQRRPDLNLSVSYGRNALGGERVTCDRPGPPSIADLFEPCPEEYVRVDSLDYLSTLGQFYDGILGQVFEGWNVGLNLTKPLQNRSAKAQSRVAELALDQGRLELQDLMLTIRTEVRTAARGVETAGKQIDSARVSRELAEKNLDAAQKRYENGLWTSFQVLEIQEDLTAARSREVEAITGYRRALLAYFRAIGMLLDQKGIELVDDAEADS
ncbi:MAG: TolC family protein [Acidobacteria bacterium]|nr:TolC family protein [Acidobacteriota bacterium]